MNKFAILVLLFTAVFAKTIAPVTEEDIVLEASVEDFLKCVHEAEPVVKDVAAFVEAIKTKDSDKIIEALYTIIVDGNATVIECIKLIPSLEEYLKKIIKFNWDDFLKCILNTKPLAKEILQVVQYVIKKDFGKLLPLVYQLYLDGSKIIKECIAVFKPKQINLQFKINWQGLLKCIQEVKTQVPEVKKLIDLIKSKKYVKAGVLAIKLLKKGVTIVKNCKSYIR